jgi:hypothetical protein
MAGIYDDDNKLTLNSLRVEHLNHTPYNLHVTVFNDSAVEKRGMVRVFLAPRYNEQNEMFAFNDHRRMMIELDKFSATCKS